jgi:hypothetical protein
MICPQRKTQKHHFSHSRKHELFHHQKVNEEEDEKMKTNVIDIFSRRKVEEIKENKT